VDFTASSGVDAGKKDAAHPSRRVYRLSGLCSAPYWQQEQQTGMLFIIMQQEQPAFIMAFMQSQQAWIMSQQALSPLVQVIMQPSLVISHLHMPIIRLQFMTIMPFIIMQHEHMPPAIMLHRFCMAVQAVASLHEHMIFMPPVIFSNFIVQRGTIIMFIMPGAIAPAGIGMVPAAPIMPISVMPIVIPRFIIVCVMI